MTKVSVDKATEHGDYLEEQITVDNIPDIGDKTGVKFLDNLEQAIAECRKLIADGYRLTGYWTDPDVGIVFNLKKKK
ncbi:hypothetical protein PTH_0453 [Pelotomaculum thermopropionicum SI]|uniref:Uncharacterized protein n=1 Tax=Pelotomaculum thermopropionicum (strain DSM 13744 / JCM 10971 / SI) TaxID=370438 RepID=A5D531_PELTS|nr:hypothetical protein PTH_0453 [Pelotomaculum thermopropionicum SI]